MRRTRRRRVTFRRRTPRPQPRSPTPTRSRRAFPGRISGAACTNERRTTAREVVTAGPGASRRDTARVWAPETWSDLLLKLTVSLRSANRRPALRAIPVAFAHAGHRHRRRHEDCVQHVGTAWRYAGRAHTGPGHGQPGLGRVTFNRFEGLTRMNPAPMLTPPMP